MLYKKILIIFLLVLFFILGLFLTYYNIQVETKININSCSYDDLICLPGIGEKLAKRIIQNRPYESINDLDSITGIGPVTINKIKDKVVYK